jgi:hypothetical protein
MSLAGTSSIHVGQVGLPFTLLINEDGNAVDVSTATSVKTIIFVQPDGATVTKAANFLTTGIDGKITYTTIAGDLSLPGVWTIQGYVETATQKLWTDELQFLVHRNVA